MKKTNKNFLYNLIYQLFVFIIPMISIPYVSRVLGVDNVGVYSYTYSIISYFMLASMLGFNNYGSREIAKVSKDVLEKSKKFFSIYFLQLITTVLMILIYFVFLYFYKYDNKIILLIQFLYLLSCCFDINWYFFGVEKFKITISRNMIIKSLSLILIFLFVKSTNDLWIYTLILSSSTLLSQMYLWIYMKNEVKIVKVSFKDIFSHLPKCLVLFIPVVAYSIYRIMDKTMIGALTDTIQLGNYESAEKIISIPLSIVAALGTVMLPHMAKSNDKDFNKNVNYTFKLCFFMLFPIFIGLITVADSFSSIFFGDEFIYVHNLIRILVVTILFSGITNIIRTNFLIPRSKDKIYVKSTIYGALINLILNIIFIKKFGAYGACIGTIAAEFVVMIYQVIYTRKDINFVFHFKSIFPFFIKSLIMGGIIFLIGLFIDNIILKLVVQISIGCLIYILLNYNYIINDFFGKSSNKKKHFERRDLFKFIVNFSLIISLSLMLGLAFIKNVAPTNYILVISVLMVIFTLLYIIFVFNDDNNKLMFVVTILEIIIILLSIFVSIKIATTKIDVENNAINLNKYKLTINKDSIEI